MKNLLNFNQANIDEFTLYEIWRTAGKNLKLKTKRNDSIEVISVGEFNSSDGPDFINTKVRINGKIFTGDVEFHIKTSDWKNHKHNTDSRYNTVILHIVIFDNSEDGFVISSSGRKIITAEIENISSFLNFSGSKDERIKCYGLNRAITSDEKLKWVKKLGLVRLFMRSKNYGERLLEIIDENFMLVSDQYLNYLPTHKSYSLFQLSHKFIWDQLLYEKIIEGLGYSKNKIPFQKIARNLTLNFISDMVHGDKFESRAIKVQALFFGVAGLIQHFLRKRTDHETRLFLQELYEEWEKMKRYYRREVLNISEWKFSSVRPANSPVFKLAGASFLTLKMLESDFLTQFKAILLSNEKHPDMIKAMTEILRTRASGFWENHFGFSGKVEKKFTGGFLIGTSKSREIIVNAVFPVMILFGRIFGDDDLVKNTVKLYQNFPSLASNWMTSKIEDELFNGKVKINTNALTHQGGIQLYKFYCANSFCSSCYIGNRLGL